MSSFLSVRLSLLFVATKWTDELTGFFFVPAFFGATVTLSVAPSGPPWAFAIPTPPPIAAVAATAAMRYLRKLVSSGDSLTHPEQQGRRRVAAPRGRAFVHCYGRSSCARPSTRSPHRRFRTTSRG